MHKAKMVSVEIAYATSTRQSIIKLKIGAGTTIEETVRKSRIRNIFKEIDLNNLTLGIFGKKKSNNTIVEDNDRVEIYRNLKKDPKKLLQERSKKVVINKAL